MPAEEGAIRALLNIGEEVAIGELLDCFRSATGNANRLTNPRIESERKKQAQKHKERVAAGRKGAVNRWGQGSNERKRSHSSAIAEPMADQWQSESESEPESDSNSARIARYRFISQILIPVAVQISSTA